MIENWPSVLLMAAVFHPDDRVQPFKGEVSCRDGWILFMDICLNPENCGCRMQYAQGQQEQ